MPDDINELDLTDAGLKAVMGDRFRDMTETKKVISKKETATTCKEANVAQKPSAKPITAQWEPVKSEPNFLDKLKSCVMAVAPCSCLTMLVWYWNEAGLMAESIAIPSMIVSACLAGLGIGKVVSK